MRYIGAFIIGLLATIVGLSINSVMYPPTDLKPKIFVIGFSKTGTTSIGNALHMMGYRKLGWKDILSRQMVHTWANGASDSALAQTPYYDAFEDLPWPGLYREAAEMYPDAKFVLSLRKDEQTWLKSMRNHVDRAQWRGYLYFYGAPKVTGYEETILKSYRDHTAAVREYFKDQPERYTEVIVDEGDKAWDDLCRVALCPRGVSPSVPFPRSNTAANWVKGPIVGFLQNTWSMINGESEEACYHWYYGKRKNEVARFILRIVWKVASVADHASSRLWYYVRRLREPPILT